MRSVLTSIGLVWGINRGHPTNRRVLAPRRVQSKGVSSERVKTIRSIIREVTGFAPYERRAMELIRNSKVCKLDWVVLFCTFYRRFRTCLFRGILSDMALWSMTCGNIARSAWHVDLGEVSHPYQFLDSSERAF